jgi:hypothetical protein
MTTEAGIEICRTSACRIEWPQSDPQIPNFECIFGIRISNLLTLFRFVEFKLGSEDLAGD